MFNTRAEAERAGQMLVSELGLSQATVRTSPGTGVTDAGYDASRPYDEKGFFASLKDLFVPDEDRYAYAEGMRRGAVLLSATVEEGQIDRASDLLEQAGALDLDAQEATWRKSGWTGYDATAHGAATGGAVTGGAMAGGVATGVASGAAVGTGARLQAGQDETIKLMQERLVVGKREVERGRVKVRAYVVERPIEEQVVLHQESVHVERRPVDRAATAADLDAFQERTIEARATSEEAVVGKDVRVVEEIGVHKTAADRAETVRDTVRETKVDVEDTTATTQAAGVSRTPGTTGTTGTTNTAGTGVAGSVDRTLNTNVSGTNPGANAPDGTPGNPPGTMASRAVDKTLGTNVSGANPDRK
jgi:uncharacterized protein (TIGR02271 family)